MARTCALGAQGRQFKSARSDIMKFFKPAAFLTFVVVWLVRVMKILSSIKTGVLPDFYLFYRAVSNLFLPKPNFDLIVKSSYGPPFIYVPFLIFVHWPFWLAEVTITLLSLFGYLASFYLLWKMNHKKTTSLFWLLMAMMAYSFPIVYSLGMGNPLGVVTLGIYGFFVFKNKFLKGFLLAVSSLLKIFPLSILAGFRQKEITIGFASFFIGLLLSTIILPVRIWPHYLDWLIRIDPLSKRIINPSIYNQSFSSTLARFSGLTEFSPNYYYVFIFFILLIFTWVVLIVGKKIRIDSLDLSMLALSAMLLIHPYPWQYYFATLLPYLVIKIASGNYYFLLPLCLMSVDGNRIVSSGFVKAAADSSQFFAALILFFMIMFIYLNELKLKNNQ